MSLALAGCFVAWILLFAAGVLVLLFCLFVSWLRTRKESR